MIRAVVAIIAALILSAPSQAHAADIFPELILERFRAVGLPVREPVLYDAFTDPNGLLGRPGQYFSKASWSDVRGPRSAHGTIELFRTPADFERRRAYLEPFTITSIFAEYMVARWPVLMRLEHTLTPGEASAYSYQLGEVIRIAEAQP